MHLNAGPFSFDIPFQRILPIDALVTNRNLEIPNEAAPRHRERRVASAAGVSIISISMDLEGARARASGRDIPQDYELHPRTQAHIQPGGIASAL